MCLDCNSHNTSSFLRWQWELKAGSIWGLSIAFCTIEVGTGPAKHFSYRSWPFHCIMIYFALVRGTSGSVKVEDHGSRRHEVFPLQLAVSGIKLIFVFSILDFVFSILAEHFKKNHPSFCHEWQLGQIAKLNINWIKPMNLVMLHPNVPYMGSKSHFLYAAGLTAK